MYRAHATTLDGIYSRFQQIAGRIGSALRHGSRSRIGRFLFGRSGYQDLLEMPDHLLVDIGLTRHDVLRARARSLPLRRPAEPGPMIVVPCRGPAETVCLVKDARPQPPRRAVMPVAAYAVD